MHPIGTAARFAAGLRAYSSAHLKLGAFQCRTRQASTFRATASYEGVPVGSAINKTAVVTNMSEQLYMYLLQHTREPDILRQLREKTATMHGAHMQITPEQGQFMALMVELLGVKRAIEVGVFTGYSSLAVALALPADGMLVACDRDAGVMNVAREFWTMAGVQHKVDGRVGPAQETLRDLLNNGEAESFDFGFIDADKRAYDDYYELLLQLVRPGGLIAVDNVLFYGKPADPQANDKAANAIRAFNAKLLKDERISLSIVPVGDGIALCRKRP